MDIKIGMNPIQRLTLTGTQEQQPKAEMPFGDFLKKAVYSVADSQSQVEKLNEKLISGQVENLHDVTVASEMAAIQFQMLTEFTSKMVEAYREIMRIQV